MTPQSIRGTSPEAAPGRRYLIFLIIFLGLLSAFAPFVTDMYLPTLPGLVSEFDTTKSMVQLGLTSSMIGLAVGQIFFGPLSDRYGRRIMLVMSLTLFCISTAVCVLSETIEFFIAMRLLQGLGASGGIVLSRSIATDIYRGRELAKMMAIIGAVNGVAPVVAPVIGGFAADYKGWQGIFVILFCYGLLLLGMCRPFHESHPRERRTGARLSESFRGYLALFRNRRYVGYALSFAFSQGVLFSYIAGAPFIIQQMFGFSEMGFSIVFGVNAAAIGIGSGLSMRFRSMYNASLFGSIGMVALAAVLVSLSFLFGSFICYEPCVWLMLFAMGFTFTGATTMAMDKGAAHIGAAAATVGAGGFLFGGLVSPLAGLGNPLYSCATVCLICAVGSLLSLRMARERDSKAA